MSHFRNGHWTGPKARYEAHKSVMLEGCAAQHRRSDGQDIFAPIGAHTAMTGARAAIHDGVAGKKRVKGVNGFLYGEGEGSSHIKLFCIFGLTLARLRITI